MIPPYTCSLIPSQFSPISPGFRYLYASKKLDGEFVLEEIDILGVAVVEEFYHRAERDLDIGGDSKPAGRFLSYVVASNDGPEMQDDYFDSCSNIAAIGILRPGEAHSAYSQEVIQLTYKQIDRQLQRLKKEIAERKKAKPATALAVPVPLQEEEVLA